ncbi:hypothetical protein [Halovenus halobia]|uniref:hypothetical protein n=1 Tax=Halovenus halobia TaxID=3396622 RepID=UPI003F5571B1
MEWQSQVEDLLYSGESVEEVVDVGDAGIVVTSHRVLTFTPNMAGANFQQVDRPNVAGITTGALSSTGLAERSIRYGVYSAMLLLAGVFIDFGGLIGDVSFDAQATQETGAGGIVGLAQGMLSFFSQLDALMRTIGAVGLLIAVAIFAVYWLRRTPTLEIAIAGDRENIHLPRPDEPDRVIRTVESALGIEGTDASRVASLLPGDIF